MFENLIQFSETVIRSENIWWQLVIALAIVLLSLLVRKLFTRLIIGVVLKATGKTKTRVDSAIVMAFENPLRCLIVVIGFYLSLIYLPLPDSVNLVLLNLFRSTIIIFITWGFYNLVGGDTFKEIGEKLEVDKEITDFMAKIMRFIVIALAITIVAQEWDYDISGFLAGLGLGGLAFALAAKDTAANMFGGLIIIIDKPFAVGDWIFTPSVEGTVEEMSFRSTKVRTFAHALVTVPNSVIANEAVTNWTRMEKRRVSFHLGVTYSTPREKIQACVRRIKELLENNPDVHPDTIFVRFDSFNDSSLDIFIYYFTKSIAWGEFMQIKEGINYKIMEILEQEGVSVAFPSRSIYLENSQTTPVD